ncbi:hypothetical protein FRC20_004612 [Serendipita sp. 405]|nr:hypothetical protein FRC16_005288 [Serendipita sp. 398]KAG8816516.1 hypothetical protein FRC18_000935 [Serendipita sp. 400]KAG8842149.1 hypothetical protein FRC20_004612 [Serendipita sp. 405]
MRSLLSLVAPFIGALTLARFVTAVPFQPRDSIWTPAQSGCWTDNVSGQPALYHSFGDGWTSPAKCQSRCGALGYNLAGVGSGSICSCGNTIFGSNTPSSSNCTMPCSADASQTCGGPNAIQIYVKDNYPYTVGPASVLDSYNGYSNAECWENDPNNVLLRKDPASPIPSDLMTVQKCIDGCAAAGFSTAGIRVGRECTCDNVILPVGQGIDMRKCNTPCTGDATQICGGSFRNIVYHNFNTPNPITYPGVIQVLDAKTDEIMGYFDYFTASGIVRLTSPFVAETFTVTVPAGVTSQIEITSTHGIDGLPFLGLIQGTSDADSQQLEVGSWHYAVFGGTSHTAAGVPPQTGRNSYYWSQKFETSIWTINTATGDISGVWVNPDNTTVPIIPVRWQNSAMRATADVDALNAHYSTNFPAAKLRFTSKFRSKT